jgi:hypothetical protein
MDVPEWDHPGPGGHGSSTIPPPRWMFQKGTTPGGPGQSTKPAARPLDKLPVPNKPSVTKTDYPPPRRMIQNGITPGGPRPSTNLAACPPDGLSVSTGQTIHPVRDGWMDK